MKPNVYSEPPASKCPTNSYSPSGLMKLWSVVSLQEAGVAALQLKLA